MLVEKHRNLGGMQGGLPGDHGGNTNNLNDRPTGNRFALPPPSQEPPGSLTANRSNDCPTGSRLPLPPPSQEPPGRPAANQMGLPPSSSSTENRDDTGLSQRITRMQISQPPGTWGQLPADQRNGALPPTNQATGNTSQQELAHLPAEGPMPPRKVPPGLASNAGKDDLTCSVCLRGINASSEQHFLTPCAHSFHQNCFERWRVNCPPGFVTCPMCRTRLADCDRAQNTDQADHLEDQEDLDTNRIINADLNLPYRPPRGLYIHVTPDPDIGLPKSLPPPSTFQTILEEWAPLLVVSPAIPLTRQQATFFQAQCPWIQAGAPDAYSVAEAAAIQLGLYDNEASSSNLRCQRCTQPLAGNRVITTVAGQRWHEQCWTHAVPEDAHRVLWQGHWPEQHTDNLQPGQSPRTQEMPEQCILALGLGGSAIQAILDEIAMLRLPIVVRSVASVPPQNIPGDGAAETVIAADYTWGTRLVARAATLGWLSPPYQPTGRGRAAPRRLLLAEFNCARPWCPNQQPVLAIDAGSMDVKVGLLVEQHNAELCRNLVTMARTRTGDPQAFSSQELLVKAEQCALGQQEPAPHIVQFTIGSTRYGSTQGLQAYLRSLLPPGLREAGTVLWWVPSGDADFVFAPAKARAIPAIVAELRTGLRNGFPALRACVTTHGIGLDGVSPQVLPGLLAAVGLSNSIHGLRSVHCGPLHYPSRIAKQGRLDADSTIEGWKISCASIDNDHLFIVQDSTFSAMQIREAVANAIVQPCSLSLVAIANFNGPGQTPVWLIRIPAAAGPDITRWQAEGARLRIGGNSIQAKPAPPTFALDEVSAMPSERHAEAALQQRTWEPDSAPQTAPVYLGIKRLMRMGDDPEDVRRMREAAWTDPNTPGTDRIWHGVMPGVRAQLRLWNTENVNPSQTFQESYAHYYVEVRLEPPC